MVVGEDHAVASQPDDDSHTNMSSIHSGWEQSEISSLSGDSYRLPEFVGTFKQHSLHGRQAYRAALEAAFDRIDGGPSEAFLIQGDGGSGKTRLVDAMRTYVIDMGGFFVSGKFFDQAISQVSTHSTAIIDAFSDICDLLSQEIQFQLEVCEEEAMAFDVREVQASLQAKVGYNHASTFAKMVHTFAPLIGLEERLDFVDILKVEPEQLGTFKQASIAFLRAVADTQPLVIFLDDLQFADPCSLETIDALIRDVDSRNILIVCTLRNQHANCENVISLFDPNGDDRIRIENMEIENLKIDSVNSFVSEILAKDEESTLHLSEVILGKTHGNPYFVKNYLDLLRYEGYLQCDEGHWTWDISAISSCTNISDNVVEVVANKIKMLHPHVKCVLEIASCLASGNLRFPRDVLDRFALENLADGNPEHEEAIRDHITRCLTLALKEGLLEPTRSGNKFKFSHGRVLKCALDLLPEALEERLSIHNRIGSVVWDLSQDGKRDWYVLAAAEHLNKGSDLVNESEERLHLANINMKAARIARHKSANGPATEFLQKAIALMDHEHSWTQQYPVMLTLHCMAAENAMNAGRFNDCEALAAVVLEKAKTSFDKMPAYFVMTEAYSMQCRVEETLSTCIKGLALAGEQIPRRPWDLQIVYELRQTKKLLNGLSDDALLALKPLESKEKVAVMRLLVSAVAFGYISATPNLFALVTLRMVKISLRHGASRLAPAAFACWALLERSTGNLAESYRFGSLAVRMAKQMDDPSVIPTTFMVCYPFSLHLEDSLHSLIEPLGQGYNIGIETGQFFHGSICYAHRAQIMIIDGTPMADVEKQLSTFCKAVRGRNHLFPLSCTLPCWQVALNFLGDPQNDNPIMLTGTAMNEAELVREANALNNNCALHMNYFCSLFLAVFFGSWSTASKLVEEFGHFEKLTNCDVANYTIKLLRGLVAFENYRRYEKRKHLVDGRKLIKEMTVLSDAGVICCKGMLLILQAEEAATRGNMTETSKAYEKAIAECHASKQLPFETLACERAGTFMLRERMTLLCEQYLSRTQHLYKTWGAGSKQGRLDMLMEGLRTTASRFDLTFHATVNNRTIPSEANALAWEPGQRRKLRANGTFRTASKSGTFETPEASFFPPSYLKHVANTHD